MQATRLTPRKLQTAELTDKPKPVEKPTLVTSPPVDKAKLHYNAYWKCPQCGKSLSLRSASPEAKTHHCVCGHCGKNFWRFKPR